MDNLVFSCGIGIIIGMMLFFFCLYMGWIEKWSGLKKEPPAMPVTFSDKSE